MPDPDPLDVTWDKLRGYIDDERLVTFGAEPDGTPVLIDLERLILDAPDPARVAALIANRPLRKTWVHGCEVSTVLLSTPRHGLGRTLLDAPPQPEWETMVFGGPLDRREWRYPSKVAAEEGHRVVVALARLVYEAPRRTKKALRRFLLGRPLTPVASARVVRALARAAAGAHLAGCSRMALP